MAPLAIREATKADDESLIDLWHTCALTRPWNDPESDLQRARSESSTRLLVGVVEAGIVASAMVGYDGHRGWLYYLAVHPLHRGAGYGGQLIAAAERYLVGIGCPKLMLMVRSGQPALERYYQDLGYAQGETAVYGKRLIDDTPGADEDR